MNIPFMGRGGTFLTIDCGKPGQAIYEALLQWGIIVRPVANYDMPNHLRISIGTEAENQQLLKALAQVLSL